MLLAVEGGIEAQLPAGTWSKTDTRCCPNSPSYFGQLHQSPAGVLVLGTKTTTKYFQGFMQPDRCIPVIPPWIADFIGRVESDSSPNGTVTRARGKSQSELWLDTKNCCSKRTAQHRNRGPEMVRSLYPEGLKNLIIQSLEHPGIVLRLTFTKPSGWTRDLERCLPICSITGFPDSFKTRM